MVLTGHPRRAMKSTACQTPTAISAAPKSAAGTGPPGLRRPAAARSADGTASRLTNRKYAPAPAAQESTSAATPERSRPRPASGQRSQTSDNCSMTVNAAPASASVAGNVVGTPGPGLASNTPRKSDRSTTAWPAIVSPIAAMTTSTVSISPVQGVVRLEPGQSFHQNAIMATAGSANVDIGPRISSDRSVLPVPRARAKKTTAASSMPPTPSHGCAWRFWRCTSASALRCRRAGVVRDGLAGSSSCRPRLSGPDARRRPGAGPVISRSTVPLAAARRDRAASARADARRRSAARGPGSRSRGTPRWRSPQQSRPGRSRRRP